MKKALKITLISICAVFVAILIFQLGILGLLYCAHYEIISSKPDTSDWMLENDKFTVVPTIDDDVDGVTFHIEDKEGNIKYVCDREWRT